MDKIDIDLTQNPEVADLVSTMNPGDKVTVHTAIQAKTDKSVTLTIETVDAGEMDEGNDMEEDQKDVDAAKALAIQ